MPPDLHQGIAAIDATPHFPSYQAVATAFYTLSPPKEQADPDDVRILQYEVDAFNLPGQAYFMQNQSTPRFGQLARQQDTDPAGPFSNEQLDYYVGRMHASPHPMLSARYADILVEYGAPVIKKFQAAQTLILQLQACIHLHLAQPKPAWRQALWDLDRLAHVSLLLRHTPSVIATVQILDEVRDLMVVQNDHRMLLELAMIVHGVATSSLKDLMPADRLEPYCAALEATCTFYWDRGNFLLHRQACERLISCRKAQGVDDTVIRGLLIEIGRSHVAEAAAQNDQDPAGAVHRVASYEAALRQYRDIGATEMIPHVKVALKAASAAATALFVQFETTVELDRATIEHYIDAYRALDSVEQALECLATDDLLVVEAHKVRALVADPELNDTFLAALPRAVMTKDRTVVHTTTPQENADLDFVQHYVEMLQVLGLARLFPVFAMLIEEKGLSAAHLLQRLQSWDVLQAEHVPFLTTGFERFFAGDYISALHVLTPRLEAVLRSLVAQAGYSTTTIKQGMTQHEETLTELLRRDEVRAMLLEDDYTYLKVVLVEQAGLNLRNTIAHGLIEADACGKFQTMIIIHLFLRLSRYVLVTPTEDTPENMPRSAP